MSTHKAIDRICVAAVALSLLLTAVFMNGKALGLQSAGKVIGYETRLFDTSRVHTIEIVMNDWDSFIETCQNEEYSACHLVIDGESYKNVGIRAKGNTSLSSVSAMGSSRYSFKIEFDQYDSTKSYHGLDKLSLNNLIQDNTMMKDYLTYQMMNAFGVASPLCSFVYITVNGEDWGLYLAVEGVEEGFLQRNYGSAHGELYKPDSLSFGGGRGNGRDFDINDFANSSNKTNTDASNSFGQPGQTPDFNNFNPPSMPDSNAPENTEGNPPAGQDKTQQPSVTPLPGADSGDFDPSSMFGGGFSFGSDSDVKLQYIDDNPDSYANIFDNAKTDISKADKTRLIASLQSLSNFENLDKVLDKDAVLRYFVVHNFVVNGDSYTGSMIHNYYLYEENGRLSMIPWDYNLAFGTFQAGSADSAVNSAIDDALTDRPMQAWIFTNETYTQQYHELYAEFLDTVDFTQIIDDAYTLIASSVEKDPTKFCTYEEFETGVQTLKTFCALRRESVQGQLAGTVPTTSTEQNNHSEALVNASDLNLSDMGTMNNGGTVAAGAFGSAVSETPGGFPGNAQPPDFSAIPDNNSATQQPNPEKQTDNEDSPDAGMSTSFPEQDRQNSEYASLPTGLFGNGNFSPPNGDMPGNLFPSGDQVQSSSQGPVIILLGVSILTLAAGLLIAFKYKR